MSVFTPVHNALQHSTLGKGIQQVKKHPAAAATAARFALACA